MLRSISDKDTAKGPERLAIFRCLTIFYIQVIGPGSVRIAQNPQQLQTDTGGTPSGLSITQLDGIREFKWRGELWIVGDVPNVQYEFVETS